MTAWVELDRDPDADCVLALSDDGAGGSLDALQLNVETSGGTAKAIATAAGSASTASKTGLAATGRQFVAAVFTSASSRKVYVGGSYGTAETTTRAVGNFTHVSIGALHSGSVTASFDGPICHAAIWTGVDADHVDLMVDQLARGVKPTHIWHGSNPTPYMYQPLVNGANETGKVGATLTATDVEFESDILDAFANEEISASERNTLLALARFRKPNGFRGNPQFNSSSGFASNSGYASFRWPDDISTPGPIANRRVVVLGSDSKITLADGSASEWIGVTQHGRAGGPRVGYESTWWRQFVRLRGGPGPLAIDEADGASFTVGTSEAFLAADGKVDDSGTVAIGVVIASADDVATVVPY